MVLPALRRRRPAFSGRPRAGPAEVEQVCPPGRRRSGPLAGAGNTLALCQLIQQAAHVDPPRHQVIDATRLRQVVLHHLYKAVEPLHIARLEVGAKTLAQVPGGHGAHCQHAGAHCGQQPERQGVDQADAHQIRIGPIDWGGSVEPAANSLHICRSDWPRCRHPPTPCRLRVEYPAVRRGQPLDPNALFNLYSPAQTHRGTE